MNADFLKKRGVAIQARDSWQAAALVAQMLNGGGQLHQMKSAIRVTRRPVAAREAARLILQSANV